jgi:hypothetical protein
MVTGFPASFFAQWPRGGYGTSKRWQIFASPLPLIPSSRPRRVIGVCQTRAWSSVREMRLERCSSIFFTPFPDAQPVSQPRFFRRSHINQAWLTTRENRHIAALKKPVVDLKPILFLGRMPSKTILVDVCASDEVQCVGA